MLSILTKTVNREHLIAPYMLTATRSQRTNTTVYNQSYNVKLTANHTHALSDR